MANSLPSVGSDDNTWGTILNDYLLVAHNANGTAYTATLVTASTNNPYYVYDESPTNINETILVDCSDGAVLVYLPDATDPTWNTNIYTIKKTDDSSNTLGIVAYSSQTIDGSNEIGLFVQYLSVVLVSDGSNWNII